MFKGWKHIRFLPDSIYKFRWRSHFEHQLLGRDTIYPHSHVNLSCERSWRIIQMFWWNTSFKHTRNHIDWHFSIETFQSMCFSLHQKNVIFHTNVSLTGWPLVLKVSVYGYCGLLLVHLWGCYFHIAVPIGEPTKHCAPTQCAMVPCYITSSNLATNWMFSG